MKTTFFKKVFFFLTLFTVGLSYSYSQNDQDSLTASSLKSCLYKQMNYVETHNVKALNDLLSNDFMSIRPRFGPLSKQKLLELLATKGLNFSKMKPEDNITITITGNVGIIRGYGTMHEKIKGEDKIEAFIFTNVWIFQNNKWYSLAWHSNLVKIVDSKYTN